MAFAWETKLLNSIKIYSKKHSKIVTYGTAGFRTKAEDLEHVVFRMGILATIRSQFKNSNVIGLMITASHNPEPDNGIKLVDPMGEMLEQSWETIATSLANCDDNKLIDEIKFIYNKCKINMDSAAVVMIGKDTRPSSASLSAAAAAGARALGSEVIDHGVVTTPMLHYYVAIYNQGSCVTLFEDNYINTLTEAFIKLKSLKTSNGNYTPEIIFDGANGVGVIAMQKFLNKLHSSLNVTIYNSDYNTKGKLNHKCGADYVKTNQRLPEGIEVKPGQRCASVDGDADRLLYYYIDSSSKFHLLDGDRIATLVAGYLMELVTKCEVDINLGLVQTAYANGSSTNYISNQLKVPVACVPTGVKYLHHKALEFDIGVYFEANGHGTVLFSKNAQEIILKLAADPNIKGEKKIAARELSLLMDLINETTGDAISDLLLVETVLYMKGWDVENWTSTYTDLPNKLLTVKVEDRNVIVTTNAERECTKPGGLQEEINRLVAQYPSGRSFVRPSGTEDLVRVYAEAASQHDVNVLASEVALAVYNLAKGIGEPPVRVPSSSL